MANGAGEGGVYELAKAKQNFPQFASLRIPSRVRQPLSRYSQPHLPSQDEAEEDDPGLDLIEAEVDSMSEEQQQQQQQQQQQAAPLPAPRQTQQLQQQQQQQMNERQKPCYMNMPFPLRAAQSVDAMQVKNAPSMQS